MARIDSFLRLVAEQKASDLHFHAGNPPIIRMDGELTPLPFRPLGQAETKRFLLEIMTPEQRVAFETKPELDLLYELPGVARFRTNILQQTHGMGAVFRIIPKTLPDFDAMGLPASVRRLTQHQNGLVLVCGPTGSGKTTTLAAMVAEINRTSQRHIITIEDPIEFVHPSIQCMVTQRQVGVHTETFASALRSTLRESPDVLVVGEMRDAETIGLALQAAETGVLVLATLHTNSASKAIDRIIDVMPDEAREQARGTLSVLLRGVIAQQLCRRLNADGRVAAVEVLLMNYAVAHMIRDGKLHQLDGALETASNDGSGAQSLDHALFKLVRDEIISREEALSAANIPPLLAKRIDTIPQEQ
ncbi:MAG: PilT/PilU family type 4a pilus ATPase [Archangium sp.]|nr:PilT/PilU family type 4a pilus ATPase [Archangium sp.]